MKKQYYKIEKGIPLTNVVVSNRKGNESGYVHLMNTIKKKESFLAPFTDANKINVYASHLNKRKIGAKTFTVRKLITGDYRVWRIK